MRFARTLNWLLKAFPFDKGGFENPQELSKNLQLTVDAFGTSRINELKTEGGFGDVGATFVLGSNVPAEHVRFVLYALGTHSEAGPKTVFFSVMNPFSNVVPNTVQVNETAKSLASSNPLGLPWSPLIIPSGGRLEFRSLDVIAAQLEIRYHYIDVPVGEYIRYHS